MLTSRSRSVLVVLMAALALAPAAEGARLLQGRFLFRLAASRPRAVPNQIVVRFCPEASVSAKSAVIAAAGAKSVQRIPQLGVQVLQLPNPRAAAAILKSPHVLWAEPNRLRFPLLAQPNDPAFTYLDCSIAFDPEICILREWDAENIQAHSGWSIWPNRYYTGSATGTNKGADAVRIAVIDSGIDYTHEDFINQGGTGTDVGRGGQLKTDLDRTILGGNVTAGAADDNGHGTHVTGIAAAATNNGKGCTGNGYNAEVVSVKVVDAVGNGTEADIAQAIVYAADAGCLIENISLGGYDYSQLEQDAVNYAWNKGTLVIAAAGNDGVDTKPNYPGALSRVLAVSAVGMKDLLSLYSNYGHYIGIAAPGGDFDFDVLWFVDVFSTMPMYEVTLNDPDYGVPMEYAYLEGTSMASPQVAGLAALYAGMMRYTQQTPDVCLKIFQALQRGADDISGGNGGWNPYYGFGRINVYQTMNLPNDPNPRRATQGCVTGQVRYRGTLVPNAVVRARQVGGAREFTGTSRLDGGYRIANVTAGLYNITATVFGESQTINNVPVTAGCDIPGIDFNIGETGSGAPGNLQAIGVSADRIDLTWTPVQDAAATYRVERSTDGGQSFQEIANLPAGSTAHSDTGRQSNRTYHYRVRALTDQGYSPYSSVAAGLTYPATPTGLMVNPVGNSRLDLTWQGQSSQPSGFKVERSPDGVSYVQIAQLPAGGTDTGAYMDDGLPAATRFWYRVRATNASGDSGYTPPVSATTGGGGGSPPPAPGNLIATAVTTSQIDLTWTDPDGSETSFRIERRTATSDWTEIATVAANTTAFSATGLTPETAYDFRVRGSNNYGESGYSNVASATTLSDMAGVLSAPNKLNLGKVKNGKSKTKYLDIRNLSGTTRLRVTPGSPAAPFALEKPAEPVVLNPGEIVRLGVRFSPTKKGKQKGMLTLNSTDPNLGVLNVRLVGTGR